MIDGLRVVLDSSSSLAINKVLKWIFNTSVLMSCVSKHNECILLRLIVIVLALCRCLKTSLNDYQNGSPL
jgi:hypothetical protein